MDPFRRQLIRRIAKTHLQASSKPPCCSHAHRITCFWVVSVLGEAHMYGCASQCVTLFTTDPFEFVPPMHTMRSVHKPLAETLYIGKVEINTCFLIACIWSSVMTRVSNSNIVNCEEYFKLCATLASSASLTEHLSNSCQS